jgi:transposase
VAEAASGGAGSDRLERRDRLVGGDPGRGGGAGEKGGSLTGPNSVDRGKTGSKLHVLSDANGLPLLVGVSAANTHDSHALQPMVMGLPAIRSRRGPRRRKPARLRADKAYDSVAHRTWLRERGIIPRIARRGISTSVKIISKNRWYDCSPGSGATPNPLTACALEIRERANRTLHLCVS